MVLDAKQMNYSMIHASPKCHRGKGKVAERLDAFLEELGYYRKQTAKDASCIFRAVSEQLFYSQRYHMAVRMACINFMERNVELFSHILYEKDLRDQIRRMRSPREWASLYEIEAMSLFYKRDFLVFQEEKGVAIALTQNNFANKILLCQIGRNHYDSLFRKSFIEHAAVCQSIVYDVLYSSVFGIEDVDLAAKAMLNTDSANHSPAEHNTAAIGIERHRSSMTKSDNNALVNLNRGLTPFPYKVAKALAPTIYRNIEFDLWVNELRESRKNGKFRNEVLQVGSKCLVSLPSIPGRQFFAYIQEMQPNDGPVTVFVEGLGMKCVIQLAAVQSLQNPVTYSHPKEAKSSHETNRRFLPGSFGVRNCRRRNDHKFLAIANPKTATYKNKSFHLSCAEGSSSADPVDYENGPYMECQTADFASEMPISAPNVNPGTTQEMPGNEVPYYVLVPPIWPTNIPVPVAVTYVNGQPVLIPLSPNIQQPVYPPPMSAQAIPCQDLSNSTAALLMTNQQEVAKTTELLEQPITQSFEGQILYSNRWNDPYQQWYQGVCASEVIPQYGGHFSPLSAYPVTPVGALAAAATYSEQSLPN